MQHANPAPPPPGRHTRNPAHTQKGCTGRRAQTTWLCSQGGRSRLGGGVWGARGWVKGRICRQGVGLGGRGGSRGELFCGRDAEGLIGPIRMSASARRRHNHQSITSMHSIALTCASQASTACSTPASRSNKKANALSAGHHLAAGTRSHHCWQLKAMDERCSTVPAAQHADCTALHAGLLKANFRLLAAGWDQLGRAPTPAAPM